MLKLSEISQLINDKKLDKAEIELSRLGSLHYKNPEYLFLRSKIFYLKKLYYLAIDTLLVALEFEKNEKFFSFLSTIYLDLGNKELSNKLLDQDLRITAINNLKNALSGIYKINKS